MMIKDIENIDRLSPSVTDVNYRCPVSTPTLTRRHSMRENGRDNSHQYHHHFVSFTAGSRTPRVSNTPSAKYVGYKMSSPSKRPQTKPQKKNFDCYFVNKIDRTVHIDAQTHSTWLSTLCAQPVDEIFGKYKRKTDALRQRLPTRGRNSTPGEMALQTAWSSNASCRDAPIAVSRASTSRFSAPTRNSRTSYNDQSLKLYTVDEDTDTGVTSSSSFALLPVTPISPTNFNEDELLSPRASPLFQRVFRPNHSYNETVCNVFTYPQTTDSVTIEPFQRDKRFPEIKPRRSTLSPTRKRIHVAHTNNDVNDALNASTSSNNMHDSAIQIVSVHKLPKGTPVAPVTATKTSSPTEEPISYRLPKHPLSMSLPELQGKV